MRKNWIPEIMYEESSELGASSNIPFIPVPDGEVMPVILFMFSSSVPAKRISLNRARLVAALG